MTSVNINSPTITLKSAVNQHIAGVSYRHAAAEVDDPSLDDNANPTTPVTSGADVHTRLLQMVTYASRIAGGTGTWAARYAAITPGTNDLATIAAPVVAATASATPNTLLKRDSAGGITGTYGVLTPINPFTGLNILAPAGFTGVPLAYSLNNVQKFLMDNAGSVTLGGTITAGSGVNVLTTAAGLIDAGKLTNALPAAAFPALTGDVTTVAGALVATVAKVGGATAVAVATAAASVAAAVAPAGAVVAGNAGKLVAFDGSGALVATSAATAGNVTGIVAIANGGTGVVTFAAHALLIGNGTGALLTLAPGAANNVVTSNGTDFVSSPFTAALIPVASLSVTRLLEFAPGASATNLAISVLGGNDTDANGNATLVSGVTALGGFTTPAAGTFVYWQVSRGPGATFAVSANPVTGTTAANAPLCPLPVGNRPIAQVLMRPTTTALIPLGDITDWRFSGGGGGGAATSAVSSALVIAPTGTSQAAMATQTGVATAANLVDILADVAVGTINGQNQANIPINPTKVRDQVVAGSPSLATILNGFPIPPWAANAIGIGSTAKRVQLTASAAMPIPVYINGKFRLITSTIETADATGGTGTRYVFADVTAVGPNFTLTISASSIGTANQYLIASVAYDGSTQLTGIINTGYITGLSTTIAGTVGTIGSSATAGAPYGVALDTVFRGVATGIVNGFDTSTFRFDPTMVKDQAAAGAPALANLLGPAAIPLGIAAALGQGSTAKRVQLAANAASPQSIFLNGKFRTITATIETADATGGAGLRYVVADVTGAGTGFALGLNTSAATTVNQTILAVVWYDGTQLQLGYIDTSPITGIVTPYDLPLYLFAGGSVPSGATYPTYLVVAGAPIVTVYLPRAMRFKGRLQGNYTQASTVTLSNVVFSVDNAAYGNVVIGNGLAGSQQLTLGGDAEGMLAAGPHPITMAWTASLTTNNPQWTQCQMKIRFE